MNLSYIWKTITEGLEEHSWIKLQNGIIVSVSHEIYFFFFKRNFKYFIYLVLE